MNTEELSNLNIEEVISMDEELKEFLKYLEEEIEETKKVIENNEY